MDVIARKAESYCVDGNEKWDEDSHSEDSLTTVDRLERFAPLHVCRRETKSIELECNSIIGPSLDTSPTIR